MNKLRYFSLLLLFSASVAYASDDGDGSTGSMTLNLRARAALSNAGDKVSGAWSWLTVPGGYTFGYTGQAEGGRQYDLYVNDVGQKRLDRRRFRKVSKIIGTSIDSDDEDDYYRLIGSNRLGWSATSKGIVLAAGLYVGGRQYVNNSMRKLEASEEAEDTELFGSDGETFDSESAQNDDYAMLFEMMEESGEL